MSFRTTYILFGVLGLLVIVFGVALFFAPPTPVDEKYILPSAHDSRTKVNSDEVMKVEIERKDAGVSLVFTREKKKDGDKETLTEFVLESPGGYRVNSHTVETVISQVLNAQAVQGDLSTKLKEYGLDNPRGHVSLTTDKGKTLTINLGEVANERVYVTSSDRPKTPRVMQQSSIDTVFNELYAFRATDLVNARTDDIAGIRIEQPAKKETISLQKEDGQWRYTQPPYGAAATESATGVEAKGPTGVSAILTALTALKAEGKSDTASKDKKEGEPKPAPDKKKEAGFVEDDAKDLKKYGLESPADATMVLEAKKQDDKGTVVVLIGKEVDKSDLYYARLATPDEKHVVTVTKKVLEPFQQLLGNPAALRDRDLVRLNKPPDFLKVRYPGGEEVEFARTKSSAPPIPGHGHDFASESWKMYRGKEAKPEATDAEAVKKLVDLLTGKGGIKEFPDAKDLAALGLDDPQNLRVQIWSNALKEPEKKEDDKEKKDDDKEKKEEKKPEEKRPQPANATPDVELIFGRPDGKNLVAVRRKTGKDLKQVDVLKVDGEVFKTASEEWLAYLDKSVAPLYPPETKLGKVTVEFDAKQTVLERKKPDDTASDWVLKKPAEWDGRSPDSAVLNHDVLAGVNNLKAARWVAIKPGVEKLGDWGLKAPTSKVTVEWKADSKPKEVSLLIGNPTPDSTGLKGYYVKKSDDDKVFVIEKSRIDAMKSPLMDMTVIPASLGVPQSLKITKGEVLGNKSLVLERKSGAMAGWEAKGSGGAVKVNNARVENLVEALTGLKAKKFVTYKTGPTPAQGLDIKEGKQGALEVEITYGDKDKKKVVLTLGAAEGDGLLATSDQLKGDVFVVGKGTDDVLAKVKEKIEFLVTE